LYHSRDEDGPHDIPSKIMSTMEEIFGIQHSSKEEERFHLVKTPGFRFNLLISSLQHTTILNMKEKKMEEQFCPLHEIFPVVSESSKQRSIESKDQVDENMKKKEKSPQPEFNPLIRSKRAEGRVLFRGKDGKVVAPKPIKQKEITTNQSDDETSDESIASDESISEGKTDASVVNENDTVFHDDNMFMKLWKDNNAAHETYISEREIEQKMSRLWEEKQDEMEVDFAYKQYHSKVKMFDQRIKECKRMVNKSDGQRRILSLGVYKQRAEAHYKEAKKYLRQYYLINHKTAILAVKKEKREYFGLVNILGKDNILRSENIKLPNDWFQTQTVKGFKEQVDEAAKDGKLVKVNYFTDRITNDQVVRLKYQRNNDDPEQSVFIGLNVDKEEFTYSMEEAKKQFPENLINEAIRRADVKKRKYVSIPPGNAKRRNIKFGPCKIEYKQQNKELCLPLSLANALWRNGLINPSIALFSIALTTGTRMEWNIFNQLIMKLCPQMEMTIKKNQS